MVFDFIINNDGKVVIGQSDDSHVQDILLNQKGSWKNVINLGIGINFMIQKRLNKNDILRIIRHEITADGGNITELSFEGDNINITADYG